MFLNHVNVGYDLHSSLINNIKTKEYKEIKKELNHEFSEILSCFTFGIILLGPFNGTIEGYKGFWIYSKESYELLYHNDQNFIKLHGSKEHILIEEFYDCWLFSFKKSNDQLIAEKRKVDLLRGYKHVYFVYPFVSFKPFLDGKTPVLIDLRHNKDLIKEYNILIPTRFQTTYLNQSYFIIKKLYDKTLEMWVFKLDDFKAPPIKVDYDKQSYVSLEENMFFVYSQSERSIQSYNLSSNVKTTIPVSLDCIQKMNKNFVIGGVEQENILKVYTWNSDYKKLIFLESFRLPCNTSSIRFIHPSLSLITFVMYKKSCKTIRIFSKNKRKRLLVIKLSSNNYSMFEGDGISKLYCHYEENNKLMLCIFDFGFSHHKQL